MKHRYKVEGTMIENNAKFISECIASHIIQVIRIYRDSFMIVNRIQKYEEIDNNIKTEIISLNVVN